MDIGQRAGADQPRHLYRRSRLRDLGGAGVPAPAATQEIMEAGRDLGIVQFRHARAAVAAPREELSDLVPRAPADLRAASKPASTASSIFEKNDFIGREAATEGEARGRHAAPRHLRGRHATMPMCSATSRSGTRARSSAGSPPAAMRTSSTSRWRRATCRSELAGEDGFEIEIIGDRYKATIISASRCSIPRASACGGRAEPLTLRCERLAARLAAHGSAALRGPQ